MYREQVLWGRPRSLQVIQQRLGESKVSGEIRKLLGSASTECSSSRVRCFPMWAWRLTRVYRPLVLCLVWSLAGCQLPDVTGFAEGTAAVHGGVDRSGTVFRQGAVRVLGAGHADIKTFDEQWQKRLVATEALVRYADSLAAVVNSANRVNQNVTAFANSADDLASSMGVVGLAGSEAFHVGGEFYKLGVQVGAYWTLDKAVAKTQNAINHIINNILIVDLEDMRKRLGVIEQAALMSLETEELEDERRRLRQLLDRRRTLYEELESEEDFEENRATHLPLLAQLDVLIEPSRATIAEHERQMRVVSAEIDSHQALLTRTIKALEQLSVSHQELARALKDGRQLSARNLSTAAVEIAQTIDRIERMQERQDD